MRHLDLVAEGFWAPAEKLTYFLLFPALIVTVLLCGAFYLVGRALDEVFNPRLRRR